MINSIKIVVTPSLTKKIKEIGQPLEKIHRNSNITRTLNFLTKINLFPALSQASLNVDALRMNFTFVSFPRSLFNQNLVNLAINGFQKLVHKYNRKQYTVSIEILPLYNLLKKKVSK
ncbi:hypothetical protein BpHYR1_029728 [Brachionus plicatilis]|uniref:Uncharacterized protein n=1 Tax=Brachionus plicatilis TaxID=10195 RepID=A0A3M7QQL6_BRAPC|nr:hypothetical protein BpHYR1_029728 [Brachionus plicatilis]